MASQTVAIRTEPAVDHHALARLFSVLADPTRIAVLELLLQRPRTVRELVDATGAPRSRVSNHLACLRWCGFATSEREGRDVIYRITDRRVRRLLTHGRELAKGRTEHLASCRRIGPDWI
jgi:DNA-binding transcriptional ArsR family regulator